VQAGYIANVYGIVNTVVLTEGILVSSIEIHHKVQRDASIAKLDNRQNSVRISDTVLWLAGHLSLEKRINPLSEHCATELN
jgi:hypothetical protein